MVNIFFFVPQIQTQIPLIDEILGSHVSELGGDLPGYRNHVYRMVNFCFARGELDDDSRAKIVIAGCFHDIGIWTGPTFDYLQPSVEVAKEYLAATGSIEWFPEIRTMIEQHHKVRNYSGSELVDDFRKADLTDLTLGTLKCGLPGDVVAGVRKAFPNNGFHRMLVREASRWIVRHPLDPLPVFRW